MEQIRNNRLTKKCVNDNFQKIKGCFSTLKSSFFSELFRSLTKYDFTDEELTDAINHIIDNYHLPPQIGSFIYFKRKHPKKHGFYGMTIEDIDLSLHEN